MKIGIDITPFSVGLGGVPKYTYALVENLLKINRDHEYRLVHSYVPPKVDLTLFSSLPRVQVVRWEGAAAFLGLLARKLPKPLQAVWLRAEAILSRPRLKSQLKGLDLFHSSDVFLWDNRPGKNIITMFDITTVLLPQFHTRANIRLHNRKIAFAQEAVHKIVAISQSTKDDLIKHCGIPAERIKVIYPGCDHSRFRIRPEDEILPVLQKYNLSRGYILSVGTIEPRKNVEQLVTAFEILARQGRRRAEQLVLVGSAGWLSKGIYSRIENSPLREHIVLLGRVPEEDLPSLYSGAAVFVYPSFYEGFGLPVLEAMACGTPVVTSDTSSLPEVVGNAGLLVTPHDAEALTAAIHHLLADPDFHQEMARKANERAQIFSWEKMAEEMLETYTEVVQSS